MYILFDCLHFLILTSRRYRIRILVLPSVSLLHMISFNPLSICLSQGQSTSEPKEIGGSSILCGNPNLIKPIPVKPNTQVKHPHLLPNSLWVCIQYTNEGKGMRSKGFSQMVLTTSHRKCCHYKLSIDYLPFTPQSILLI